MPFRITSLLKFYDDRNRYIQKIISKYQKVNDIRNIIFNVNSTEIIDSIYNNKYELNRVVEVMDSISQLKEFVIDSLAIKAGASPEGSYRLNENLAKNRGESIKKYITNISSINTDKIKLSNIVEDWQLLKELIIKDSVIENKKEILDIINSKKDLDQKELELKTLKEYNYIFEKIYPKLRNVVFTYNLTRSRMVKDTIYTQEIDSIYSKGVKLLLKREYAKANRVLQPYNCRNLAIGLLALGYNNRAIEVLSKQAIDDAYAHYLAAIAYSRVGDFDNARKEFKESVKYDRYLKFRASLDPEISQLNIDTEF